MREGYRPEFEHIGHRRIVRVDRLDDREPGRMSGFAIGDCARYVADWLRGKAPPSPRDGFSAPLILRFAVDDLKAYGLEAAGAEAAKPSSRQLTDWFWNETATGAAIHVLREVLQAYEDERLRLIVSNFVVPAARVRGG